MLPCHDVYLDLVCNRHCAFQNLELARTLPRYIEALAWFAIQDIKSLCEGRLSCSESTTS